MKKIIVGSSAIIVAIIVVIIIILSGKKTEAPISIVPEEEAGVLSGIIDQETSRVTYTGFGVGKEHVGIFPIHPDSAVVVDETGMIVSGEIIFDMTQLTADGDTLLGHLKSADFFDVENYPTARYEIKEVVPTPLDPENDIIVNGELTLTDTTRAHNIVGTYDAERGIFEFSTGIDRTQWGIDFNSSTLGEFGDSLIQDTVQIDAMIDID